MLALGCLACGSREAGIEVFVEAQVTSNGDSRFTTATLAIEQVELIPCATARWWHALSPISTAWAHGDPSSAPTNPLVVRAPVLLDLQRAEVQALATVRPPPSSVCGLALSVAPSTADAPSQGTTLFLESPTFRQLSTRQLVVTHTLEPVLLDEAHRTAHFTLHLTTPNPAPTGDQSLTALLATLTL